MSAEGLTFADIERAYKEIAALGPFLVKIEMTAKARRALVAKLEPLDGPANRFVGVPIHDRDTLPDWLALQHFSDGTTKPLIIRDFMPPVAPFQESEETT